MRFFFIRAHPRNPQSNLFGLFREFADAQMPETVLNGRMPAIYSGCRKPLCRDYVQPLGGEVKAPLERCQIAHFAAVWAHSSTTCGL